jgi:hypothetical protein
MGMDLTSNTTLWYVRNNHELRAAQLRKGGFNPVFDQRGILVRIHNL